jgi:hypothetical protein
MKGGIQFCEGFGSAGILHLPQKHYSHLRQFESGSAAGIGQTVENAPNPDARRPEDLWSSGVGGADREWRRPGQVYRIMTE